LDKVWWSAIDDAANFDISETNQADFQRLLSVPGPITGLSGGEYGLIFKASGIYRMDYVGTPLIYRFEEISSLWGTTYPRSIVRVDQDVYFMSPYGPAVVRRGQTVEPIRGFEKIWFYMSNTFIEGSPSYQIYDFTKSAKKATHREAIDVGLEGQYVVGAFCPISRTIFWSYPVAWGSSLSDVWILAFQIDSASFSFLNRSQFLGADGEYFSITSMPPTYYAEAPTKKTMPSIAVGVCPSTDLDKLELWRFEAIDASIDDGVIYTGAFELESGFRAKIIGTRLISRTYSSDTWIDPVSEPPFAYSITVRSCENPHFSTYTEQAVTSSSGINTDEILPYTNVIGQWFQIKIGITGIDLSVEYLSSIIGLEIWYELESE